VSGLTALDAEFADGNVPLGALLGTIGALTTVRSALPQPQDRHAVAAQTREAPRAPDAFTAMMLGVVAVHGRLTALVDPTRSPGTTDEPALDLPMTGLGR
jgi:hypothetical protein